MGPFSISSFLVLLLDLNEPLFYFLFPLPDLSSEDLIDRDLTEELADSALPAQQLKILVAKIKDQALFSLFFRSKLQDPSLLAVPAAVESGFALRSMILYDSKWATEECTEAWS
ncbi:hypothetical protein MRB53_007628 [Persea americana]|uniref:Uncharacterized protein n=1 Tax=Persea americana TaxID=3435 RepID=A0ACC2MJI6_PERAE|nr:hypothetical protein MRB53_007628 [Persea americana]